MQWISTKHASLMLTIADHTTCNSKKSVTVLLPAVAENTGNVAQTWKGTALKATKTNIKGTVQCMVSGQWNLLTVG
jgi:hypothetical protein